MSRIGRLGKSLGLVVVVGFALLVTLSPSVREQVADGARALAARGDDAAAMLLFVAIYTVAIALGVPGSVLTLVGGAAFGLWTGFALSMTGSLLGCLVAFYEGRFLAAGTRLGRRLGRVEHLDEWPRAFVLFLRLRLMPLLPFSAVNFSAGLTRAPVSAYLAGSALGIVPSTFLFTLFAHELAGAGDDARRAVSVQVAIALVGLLLLSFAPNIVRYLRARFG